jgi:alginate O-acetyltransferase complex protein AlgI
MLFNSIEFLCFLPIVFCLYWLNFFKNLKLQNILLLFFSYYFYSCWNWKFLFLLIFSTLLDYYTSIQIEKSVSSKRRKFWFYLSISTNLLFLGVFKYYNFFASSLSELLNNLGVKNDFVFINIILPVGISFYTFHGLSYVIDVYKKRINVEKSFVDYALFVSFFPLLVAGPIERATHLLPQIKQKRKFDYSTSLLGLKQILWGFFKKIVIADSCANYANSIFNNYGDYSGGILWIGAICFAIQIYGDFSGYSDIALGVAKLFGFELLKNFSYPYFSRDIAEFWRRWHMSLSTWFRDYLYIPLGGSKGGTFSKIRNTFVIFIVSGFWHGANWTFIFWGVLNAIYFLPLLLRNSNRNNLEIVASTSILPSFKEFFNIIITFSLVTLAWVFFRSPDLSFAFNYLIKVFVSICNKSFYIDILNYMVWKFDIYVFLLVLFFFSIEWIGRKSNFAIESFSISKYRFLRYMFYTFVLFTVVLYSILHQQKASFIYFQF